MAILRFENGKNTFPRNKPVSKEDESMMSPKTERMMKIKARERILV